MPGYLRCFLTFWHVLRQSEAFSCVLSCTERLLNIEKFHLKLWGDQRYSCGFWKVHLKMWDILWCSGMFWRILKCYHEFWIVWNIPVCLEAFYEVQRHHFRGLWVVLNHYWKLWDVLWRPEVSWGIVRYSAMFGWFYTVLNALEKFWGVCWHCKLFWVVLRRSHEFWAVLKGY